MQQRTGCGEAEKREEGDIGIVWCCGRPGLAIDIRQGLAFWQWHGKFGR
jgi:hypothetical protein